MAKQKQIEEMYDDISKQLIVVLACEKMSLAIHLHNAGYRKIPEGAVVLTEEEYKKLKHGSGTLEQLYNQYPYRVLVGFNSMVFSQDRESYERLYDEIEKKASKETAEEFVEMLNAEDCSIPIKDDFIIIPRKKIDEICKEITKDYQHTDNV